MQKIFLNVTHLKQSKQYTCVPACVRVVLDYLGFDLDEEQLSEILSTTPRGTTASNIARIQDIGVDVVLRSASLFDLRNLLKEKVPHIVFLWTGNLEYWNIACWHAVVVVGIEEDVIYINDPFFSDAPKKVVLDSFLEAWSHYDFILAEIRKR